MSYTSTPHLPSIVFFVSHPELQRGHSLQFHPLQMRRMSGQTLKRVAELFSNTEDSCCIELGTKGQAMLKKLGAYGRND